MSKIYRSKTPTHGFVRDKACDTCRYFDMSDAPYGVCDRLNEKTDVFALCDEYAKEESHKPGLKLVK